MSVRTIYASRNVLRDAKEAAERFRQQQTESRTLVVNVLSSPGAGKTSLLEATAQHWNGRHKMATLVGDLETDRDAQRLARWMPSIQLSTGGACHLELPLVEQGYQSLGLPSIDFLFVENIGNLVCPSSHDLGEHLRVVLLSTTEGDDKPAKYPKVFRTSQAMIVSKTDLLPHVPFSVEAAEADARAIQPNLTVFPTSATNGEGIAAWCRFLEDQHNRLLSKTRESSSSR